MKAALIAYFTIGALLSAVLGVLLCLVFPSLYQRQFHRPYSRKRDFPFELLFADHHYLPLGRFIVIFAAVAGFMSSGYFLSTIALYPNFIDMCIFVLAFGGCASSCFALMWLVRADVHVRLHLFSFLMFGFLSALMDFANLLAYSHFPQNQSGLRALLIAIASILALAKVALLINPKLKDWAKLESTMEQDGTVTTSRPKLFIMAFSEWCITALHFISLLAMMVSYFVLILPLI